MPKSKFTRQQIKHIDGNLKSVRGLHIEVIYESEGFTSDFKYYWDKAKELKKDYRVEVATYFDRTGKHEIYRLVVERWRTEVFKPYVETELGAYKINRNFKKVLDKDAKFKRWWNLNSDFSDFLELAYD